jgi:exosortase/archaeosortase family protein
MVRALLIASVAATLLALPFVVSFDDLLARWAAALGLDALLRAVVPVETGLAAAVLRGAGLQASAAGDRLFLGTHSALPQTLVVSWNCAGWQGLLLLAISLAVGLRGSQPLLSRLEVIGIGLAGTLLVNVVRIALVALLAARAGYVPAIVFHDYGGMLLGVAWLFCFWELAYRWVLRPGIAPEGSASGAVDNQEL